LIKPTSGEIEIFGMSLEKHRKDILRQVGAIVERPDYINISLHWKTCAFLLQ
jgi:ABC-type multidrug transport system ATPase subunit